VKNYFNDLIEIIQKEVKLYSELKILEENKKNVIINNDVRALDAITKQEQGFVKAIVQLETLRTQSVDGLCREKGFRRIDKLAELYEMLNSFESQQLRVFENKLVDVIEDIRDTNQLNEKLIAQSLEYIDFTLNLAKQLGLEDAGYGKGAQGKEVKAGKGLFDAKI
jgi:flagellar biosynthesis/type III secretory pathway chaperone